MRFIADVMLGRLARWLRLLGFDTLYYNDISDGKLLNIARREDRFILTRDRHFLDIKNLKDCLLIRSNNTLEQLIEVVKALGIKELGEGRCVRCNGILADVADKKEIAGLVPDHVYLISSMFQKCRSCGSVYWEGSHMKRFRETVCSVLSKIIIE